MIGTCSHCRHQDIVWRYRLTEVGLRYLCVVCHERLVALGMAIDPVTIEDPRREPRHRLVSAGLRWLRAAS